MRLMKDFLSDDKNMDALCDSTDLGATLLNFLELKKVITDEILDKIVKYFSFIYFTILKQFTRMFVTHP